MKILKSNYYNPNYPYTVHLWFDDQATVIKTLRSIRDWCVEAYGEEWHNPPASSIFHFKTEEQLNWFIMRWS